MPFFDSGVIMTAVKKNLKEAFAMSEKQQLLAVFAKIDMTPDYPVGLAGYSDAEKRIHEMVVEPVYTTCIALTEGEETILVFTIDNCACDRGTAEKIRAAVTEATEIPDEKIETMRTVADVVTYIEENQ